MAFQIVIIFPINTQNIYLIAEKKKKKKPTAISEALVR